LLSYYTALILLSWLTLGVLSILVWETSWISKSDKHRFYLTYGIIALSALAEWIGIQLIDSSFPAWVLLLVKCSDYVLTPMAGGAIVRQMKLKNRWNKALTGVLIGNAVFQVIAAFNQWMIVIDANNHYTHGPLYPVYIAVYLAVIVLIAVEFLTYGADYRRQNQTSLYSVLILVVVGIGIQEVLGGEYRTAYIALTIGAVLLFIHYSEFYQMSADDYIRQQQSQLMKDALTGVYSRYAYIKDLEKMKKTGPVPDDIAAMTMDINGLKRVNDTMGHEAGDELIIGAARCIEKVIGDAGRCYRTGGDEFVVLAHLMKEQAEEAQKNVEREARLWEGEIVKSLSFTVGLAAASDFKGLTVEELVKEADQAMYKAKVEYYMKSGNDRRGSRR